MKTSIPNRDELFTLIDLERSYVDATQDPARLANYPVDTLAAPVPELDEIADRFSRLDVRWLLERIAQGAKDRLVIAPRLGSIGIQDFCHMTGVRLSDEVYRRLPKEVGPYNRFEPPNGHSIAILLGDVADPLGRPDVAAINGAVFLNRSHYKQEKDLKRERRTLERQGVDVRPVTIPEFVYSHRRRDASVTRFVDLGTPNIGFPGYGLSWPTRLALGFAPGGSPGTVEIDHSGNHLSVGTSALAKDEFTGVRRVLRLQPSK